MKFRDLIIKNHQKFFHQKIIHDGFKKAFKGNWGAFSHTKKLGVIQPLNRLSYNSFLSHLRKLNLNIDASAKVVGPHLLHGSQWGIIDPIDTPDGGNVGFHKHMAMMTKISHDIDERQLITWIFENMNQSMKVNKKEVTLESKPLQLCTMDEISNLTKLFVNGVMIGITNYPFLFQKIFMNSRRLNFIPNYISCTFNIRDNYIFMYCDEGRLLRPLLYFSDKTLNYFNQDGVYNMLRGYIFMETMHLWI